ncbi:uncharacterized protein [Typha angustifolia]|uniref:uncharacterized protein n=1 Tax=Typha angustifolia TaxID=59011 RepID=UPI003C305BEF
MTLLSSLGIGLAIVSCFLSMALVAELYYLFRWKRRESSAAKDILHLFCWKRPSSPSSTVLNLQEIHTSNGIHCSGDAQVDISSYSGEDSLLEPFGEETVEAELMRLHCLSGPPRFLFTIKEETNEDLDSEDGRSRKGKRRSLSDLLQCKASPILTPLSSPPLLDPPLTQNGFNPLFESSKENIVNKAWSSSPPPKFRFLKDAEEKLYRKTLMEEALRDHSNGGLVQEIAKPPMAVDTTTPDCLHEEDGSFITFLLGKNRDRGHQHHSSSSQVIPLPSPPNIR